MQGVVRPFFGINGQLLSVFDISQTLMGKTIILIAFQKWNPFKKSKKKGFLPRH